MVQHLLLRRRMELESIPLGIWARRERATLVAVVFVLMRESTGSKMGMCWRVRALRVTVTLELTIAHVLVHPFGLLLRPTRVYGIRKTEELQG